MLRKEGTIIRMDEGDYGLSLPFKLSGDVLATDRIEIRIKETDIKIEEEQEEEVEL